MYWISLDDLSVILCVTDEETSRRISKLRCWLSVYWATSCQACQHSACWLSLSLQAFTDLLPKSYILRQTLKASLTWPVCCLRIFLMWKILTPKGRNLTEVSEVPKIMNELVLSTTISGKAHATTQMIHSHTHVIRVKLCCAAVQVTDQSLGSANYQKICTSKGVDMSMLWIANL